ncbi:MAG TPA: hypothetical protein VGM98_16300 [Schlesneria sp.]|jgi:hypothetical protein
MKALSILLRVVLGAVVGFTPAWPFILAGRTSQGIGIGMIFALCGAYGALSPVLYGISTLDTLHLGLLLSLRVLIGHNVPGGENLIPVDNPAIEGSGRTGDQELLGKRMVLGGTIGLVPAVIAGIFAAIYTPPGDDFNEYPPFVSFVIVLLLASFLFAIVGISTGAAIAALTVPGVHRRNICMGTIGGMIIGAGLTTAVGPDSRSEMIRLYTSSCGFVGWLGMGCGLMSGDNFLLASQDKRQRE